jgi:hypothetical protein
MAKDLSPLDERHHMAIEVRTDLFFKRYLVDREELPSH